MAVRPITALEKRLKRASLRLSDRDAHSRSFSNSVTEVVGYACNRFYKTCCTVHAVGPFPVARRLQKKCMLSDDGSVFLRHSVHRASTACHS